ncbi:P-loop containing nucleoside triphosphate hydrolase protein [Trametes gibbosa]|nr:P-loop containing nucleoside triphosphate hydrolase protein [Trametes gibbosa]
MYIFSANNLIEEAPRIAVIGAQSTGKSSLVEAITGVSGRYPSAVPVCPMECTIWSSESAWSCSISLHVIDELDDSFTEMSFSPPLATPAEVEIWIRRAQAAVLCPHILPEAFTSKSREELKGLTDSRNDPRVLRFTKSVVVVDIHDPNGADLSFVDLPGLIQNAEDDPTLVPLVEKMTQNYIARAATIILVSVPAEDDLDNPRAFMLAREADSEKQRTIGVLTKPDRLTTGDTGKREELRALFDGEASSHQLQKGYYCVRLPNDQERQNGLSRAKAQGNEREFFCATAPWKDLRSNRRLGVPNLVRDISHLLMGVTQAAVPAMREAVTEQITTCSKRLAALPQLLGADVAAEVIHCVVRFCDSFRRVVYGECEDKAFVRECRRRFALFERTIRHSAPDFRPSLIAGETPQLVAIPVEDDTDKFGVDRYEDFTRHPTEPITLRDVTRIIDEATGWELPHNVPYEAKKRLIQRFMEHWPAAESECFEHVAKALELAMRTEVATHFGRFPPLEVFMGSVLGAQLESRISTAREIVKNVLEREKAPYGTQNYPYLERMRDAWLSHYKSIRSSKGGYAQGLNDWQRREYEGQALTALRNLGLTNVETSDFHRLFRRDAFEDEILVMADVRSYFHVTHKRVADDVPEAIKLNLLLHFVDGLQDHLLASLKLDAADAAKRLQGLLAEDPEIALERARLKGRLARLGEIKRELDNFVM